ncbi:hypothetical protein HPB50_003839 [Hyalomma asiaticum]|uniref:Uncharacterized protein n=1 Tax=Hyalomma asiaticum TaxID=266040 RepID=A0ACB7RHE7_HYAAI|nr:hypothetical protein HPB50_003839 [Hyalomma asiaticum]
MSDLASSPSQTRTFGVPALATFVRFSRYRQHVTVFVVALAVIVVLVAVIFGTYARGHRSSLHEPASPGSDEFCCPEDAREAARYLNTTLKPCRDFYARVCDGVIKFELWKEVVRQSELERVMITGVVPSGLRSVDATQFLIAYYKSCIKTIPHEDQFVSELALALTRETRQFLGKPDTRNTLAYAARASLWYQLPSAIEVTYEAYIPVVELSLVTTLCDTEGVPPTVSKSSADAVAELITNSSVTPDEVLQVSAHICGSVVSVGGRSAWYGTVSDIDRSVWDVDAFRSALKAAGYVLNEDTRIYVKDVPGLRSVLGFYGGTGHREMDGAKAAYLLFHSVASGTRQLYTTHDRSWRHLFQACTDSVDQIDGVWRLFMAELLTTPEKDSRLSYIFVAVRDAVYRDCHENLVSDAEDIRRLRSLFKSLSLYRTMDDSLFNVPKPTLDFAVNLLRGRAYDFRVRREQQRNGDPQNFTGTLYIYVPSAAYGMVRAGSVIPDMATLGWWLAQDMWDMVLHGRFWSPKTQAAIQRLRSCFDIDGHDTSEGVPVSFVLGLSSVLKAFSRPGWDTVIPAWSLMSMSHAEIFYTLAVYNRCPLQFSRHTASDINKALAYAGDFASAFRCPPGSPMAEKPRCSLHNLLNASQTTRN